MPRAKAKAPAKSRTRSRKAPAGGRGRGRKKKGVISVDFDGVESGGRGAPDGSYRASPKKAEEKESEAGNDMIVFQWKLIEGVTKGTKKGVGATVFDNMSLTPQALWRLKGMLEACGFDVPESSFDIDLESLCAEDGPECIVEITNEEYEGRDRPRITGFFPLDTEEEEEDDEEEDDEDEDEEDDEQEDDEDEEEDEDDEEEEEAPPKRSRSRKKKEPAAKKGRARKLRVGSKVKWEDEEGDEVRGVITEMDGDDITAVDATDEEWELDRSEITPA